MPIAIPLLAVLLDQVAAPAPAPPAATTAGQIRGTISYGRHEPAVGAIVVVRPEAGVTPVHAATTGTSGSFAFNGLPDGTYRAEVSREGYAPVVKTGIGVRAPFRAVVEVQLARGDAPSDGKVKVPVASVRIESESSVPPTRVSRTRASERGAPALP